MFNLLSSQIPSCLSVDLLPVHSVHRLYFWKGLSHPRCRLLHFLSLNFVRCMSVSPSCQSSSEKQPWGTAHWLPHPIWCCLQTSTSLVLNCEKMCSTTAQRAIELLRIKFSSVNLYWLCSFILFTKRKKKCHLWLFSCPWSLTRWTYAKWTKEIIRRSSPCFIVFTYKKVSYMKKSSLLHRERMGRQAKRDFAHKMSVSLFSQTLVVIKPVLSWTVKREFDAPSWWKVLKLSSRIKWSKTVWVPFLFLLGFLNNEPVGF